TVWIKRRYCRIQLVPQRCRGSQNSLAGRIAIRPDLELLGEPGRTVQIVDQVGTALWVRIQAVNDDDGNLAILIRFQEIQPGGRFGPTGMQESSQIGARRLVERPSQRG